MSQYQYNSTDPVKISLNDLDDRNRFLLEKSQRFCIYPWIHIHAHPTGQAYPCCNTSLKHQIGNTKQQSLKEIWNGTELKKLRIDMLTEQANPACVRCYEQEQSGFFSLRKSANKHHGHHIHKVNSTHDDGTLDDFSLVYWDIRFSNLCNLKCRSCGHIFIR